MEEEKDVAGRVGEGRYLELSQSKRCLGEKLNGKSHDSRGRLIAGDKKGQ